jgi:hypothetical protein
VHGGSLAGTREGGIGPFAGELFGAPDDERVLDGGALAGDRAGVLDVVCELVEVQPAVLAATRVIVLGASRNLALVVVQLARRHPEFADRQHDRQLSR